MTSFNVSPKIKQRTLIGVSLVVFLSLSTYFLPVETVISGSSKSSELNLDKRDLNIIPTDQLCAIQLREPLSRINVA